MPAERAGYTVTMFVVDIQPSMAKLRTHDPEGNELLHEITNLQWGLQFVKLKIQEMIFNGRKTDQCGVIVFGSRKTKNILHTKMKEGYEDVLEYIPIGQPNAGTLAKLDALKPSNNSGDPLDALIVAIETQDAYLEKKKTWTRKIVGIDFDDEEYPYAEEDKSNFKAENEEFYKRMVDGLEEEGAILGTCALALRETVRPDIKITKSTLMATTLRLGDNSTRPEEAMEINIKTSKCTAQSRSKSWKKFAERRKKKGADGCEKKVVFTQLKMRTEYYVDRREHNSDDEGGDVKMEDVEKEGVKKEDVKEDIKKEPEPEPEDDDDNDDEEGRPTNKIDPGLEQVDKEELIRGFKYGTTYVPCPDGQFERLPTKKGIDICGFFLAKNFRRELCMGEIQYVWGDPTQPEQQVAISSIAQAMYEKNAMAIARWVTKDGMDAKMGVLAPCIAEGVDCLLWAQMPFADDVRKYTFASLDNLVSKKGEVLKEHAYIPTAAQLDAMDAFVDAMDLMDAGEKDEEGNRGPWFDTRLSYNPAVHRIKQAQFHAAVVSDLSKNPLPPPHPDLLKYFEPPRRVLKRAREAIEGAKTELKVKQVPKKVARARKDGHVHARDEDDDTSILDAKPTRTQSQTKVSASPAGKKGKEKAVADDSATEDDSDDDILAKTAAAKAKKPMGTPPPPKKNHNPLPTPARSLSPEFDPGRAPGRIVGNTRPLDDFKANIARGDMVSKAVEDLGAVITEIVMRPFANRRTAELMECMDTLRDTCLKEDEVEAWNLFMQNLRRNCTSEPGNSQFWSEVQKAGRKISLISEEEAEEHGGTSQFSESQAQTFLS
ncbi:SPOC domain-like protein [Mycena sanguinolenta]|uniref:ATP-dependent DNA helicase II subunit 2 n=1 Tax=Mycena sanguinolenta TaxID=230812 RepID=A0A8H6YZ65_9AGAR|nr:SPOC domain-like protein [Mycena sanguinolenta]